MQSTLMIVNPNAGDRLGEAAVCRWAAQREEVRLERTHDPGDAGRFASRALHEGVSRLIVAGGDGTIHETINGLSEQFESSEPCDGPAIGVIPLGTGNDFARNLGLSLDPQQALAELDHAQPQAVDVVRIVGPNTDSAHAYFINAASGGFSRVLHATLTKTLKQRFGPFAYLIAAGKAMKRIPWCKAHVTADGQSMTLPCCAVVAANGQYVAGGAPLAPRANPNDGTIELVIVTAENFRQRFALTVRFYLGKHLSSKRLTYTQARCVHVDSTPPMEFMCDGEAVGPAPLEIEVLHAALRVLIPPTAAG